MSLFRLIRQWLATLLLLLPSMVMAGNTVTAALTGSTSLTYTCNLEGKVIKVSDGDTITVMDTAKEKYKIRLAGIDAPEKKQGFGQAARKELSGLVAGKEVCVSWHKKDKYGRLVGSVLVDDQLVNLHMVQSGYAWHYKRFANEQLEEEREVYSAAEETARLETIGLWSEPEPVAPWDWRDGVRSYAKQAIQAPYAAANAAPGALFAMQSEDGFSCQGKQYCRHMNSCAEAKFYLTQCGVSRLDKDGDGVPCESLCK